MGLSWVVGLLLRARLGCAHGEVDLLSRELGLPLLDLELLSRLGKELDARLGWRGKEGLGWLRGKEGLRRRRVTSAVERHGAAERRCCHLGGAVVVEEGRARHGALTEILGGHQHGRRCHASAASQDDIEERAVRFAEAVDSLDQKPALLVLGELEVELHLLRFKLVLPSDGDDAGASVDVDDCYGCRSRTTLVASALVLEELHGVDLVHPVCFCSHRHGVDVVHSEVHELEVGGVVHSLEVSRLGLCAGPVRGNFVACRSHLGVGVLVGPLAQEVPAPVGVVRESRRGDSPRLDQPLVLFREVLYEVVGAHALGAEAAVGFLSSRDVEAAEVALLVDDGLHGDAGEIFVV